MPAMGSAIETVSMMTKAHENSVGTMSGGAGWRLGTMHDTSNRRAAAPTLYLRRRREEMRASFAS